MGDYVFSLFLKGPPKFLTIQNTYEVFVYLFVCFNSVKLDEWSQCPWIAKNLYSLF